MNTINIVLIVAWILFLILFGCNNKSQQKEPISTVWYYSWENLLEGVIPRKFSMVPFTVTSLLFILLTVFFFRKVDWMRFFKFKFICDFYFECNVLLPELLICCMSIPRFNSLLFCLFFFKLIADQPPIAPRRVSTS